MLIRTPDTITRIADPSQSMMTINRISPPRDFSGFGGPARNRSAGKFLERVRYLKQEMTFWPTGVQRGLPSARLGFFVERPSTHTNSILIKASSEYARRGR